MLRLVSAGGIEEFQWSTSEQVWPFEKASDGSTLYCREVDCGALPNSGYKTVSHGITGLTGAKIFNVMMIGLGDYALPIPMARVDNMIYQVSGPWVEETLIGVSTAFDYSSWTATARLIYKK